MPRRQVLEPPAPEALYWSPSVTIFVSYRRIDSAAWTGRLHDGLATVFTRSRVFMDVDGHIEVADRWADILEQRLKECRVLVAVIGPQWLTCTRNDRRRIDHDDDWVRREIATALQRRISVVPVLVGGARLPGPDDLPPDIADLTRYQPATIDDTRWDPCVKQIIEAVRRALGETAIARSSIDEAASALSLLAEQIHRSPSVAQIVGRYREALAVNVQQFTELDVYKRIHDALHDIEEHVLRMLRRYRTSRAQLVAGRSSFRRAHKEIESCLQEYAAIPGAMKDELRIGLDQAAGALDGRDDAEHLSQTVEIAIAELSALVGTLPTQLDQKIANAATALRGEGRLDRLAEELRVSAALEQTGSATDLRPLFGGLDGLEAIRAEFARLVEEHSRMQRIDAMLRTLCSTPVHRQWERVKFLRSRLPEPPSPQVQAMAEALAAFEADIDQAFATMTPAELRDRLEGLHEMFITLFHDVDAHLRKTSSRLAVIHGPLQRLLT